MLQPVIFRLGLRTINRRLFQSILFVIGVALGVAVVIAIDLANGSASRAFGISAKSITGQATHQISAGSSGLPTTLYTQLRRDLGIKLVAPVVSQFIRVDGIPQQINLLGVDPFAEPPFRNYLTTIEVLGEDDINAFEALTRFITEPNTVLISEQLASDLNLNPGETLVLRINGERHTVRVIGLLRPEDDLSKQALNNMMLTDIATAQELGALPGRISRIDLILSPDSDLEAIRALLPAGARLVSSEESSGALQQMTAAFELNLQALSLLAVVVGVFLIYNTVTFSVVQRRPVLGSMRSIGATRRQIFAFVLVEALILGSAGTLLGLGVGVIFGRFMVQAVSQTINDLYFAVNVTAVTIAPLTFIKGILLGIFSSLGAAFIPALDATRTSPAGAMKRSSLEEQTLRLVPYITLIAAGLMLGGFLLLQIPTTNLGISFTALFLIIFGGAFFTPIALMIAVRLFSPLLDRLFGILGRMAARAVLRSLSRTSVAVAALTIAVSVIIGVSVMIGSFRNTVSNWLDNTLAADIFIAPPDLIANQSTVDVDMGIREIVASVDGIVEVATSRTVQVIAPGYPDLPLVNLSAVDTDISRQARSFIWQDTPNPDQALSDGQIMVSEPFAFRRGLSQEDNQITLLTDQGEQTFEIFGVYYDYTTDQGTVLMDRAIYNRYWDDPFVTAVAAFISADAELDTVIGALESELSAYDVQVQSNKALRDSVFEVFERTFTITIALRLLATLVAFIGILSALMSLQIEHTRQYGVMRATGMTPGQLRRFTFIQTGFLGLVAGLLAIPLGLIMAMVLIYVINVRSFGWTMQFDIIPGEIAQAFLVALGAALLAGVYPALKLARINISRAVRSE